MYILGIQLGHDSGATVFDNYKRIVSVPLERMTRNKNALGFPRDAIQECLNCASLRLDQIEAIALPHGLYPIFYLRGLPMKLRFEGWARDFKNMFRLNRALYGSPRSPYGPHAKVLTHIMYERKMSRADSLINIKKYLRDAGFSQTPKVFFYEHHYAHALGALFHTDWNDAMIYTVDGRGDLVSYSCRILRNNRLSTLFGGWEESWSAPFDPFASMGYLYEKFVRLVGFTRRYHAGKVLGLSAFGKPVFADELTALFRIDDDGRVHRIQETRRFDWDEKLARSDWDEKLEALARGHSREDAAASVQKTVEDIILAAMERIVDKHQPKNIGLSGGVFANVLLNQKIVEKFNPDEIFIYPAMGDMGQAAGGVLHHLLERDGLETWLSKRHRLKDVYFGRAYEEDIPAAMHSVGAKNIAPQGEVAPRAAQMLIEGKICAIYTGRMEYGPRALGNRSILAAATDKNINNWLNKRLSRTEFMPFAPVVREERAGDVFDLPSSMRYAARFMTITCNVKEAWRDKLPAITHIDGTARPQIIDRTTNPLYYDTLHIYEQMTGLPVLINTSFNAHEEPIINTPQEAAQALAAKRVDVIITQQGIWQIAGATDRRAPD